MQKIENLSIIDDGTSHSLIKKLKEYLFSIILRYKDKSSNYPYSVTRIRGMKSKLIKKDEYIRYLNMNFDDIVRRIEELDYKNDIDELSRIYNGVELIEHSLNKNMADSFQKILNITEGEPHRLVESYLKIYDIWNIKTVIRGKLNNIKSKEILESLVTAGSLRYTFLSEIINLNLNEIINLIKKTEYSDLFKYELNETTITDIENNLDKYYYKKLFEDIGYPFTKDSKIFYNFIGREVDIKNIDTILRIKKENYLNNNIETKSSKDKILNLMIENGLELSMKKLKDIVYLPYEEFILELNKTSYWTYIKQYFNENISKLDIRNVESELLKYNLEKTTTHSHLSIMSIIPIIEYIIYKTNEVRNLRIILRGKMANLSNESIKSQLVVI